MENIKNKREKVLEVKDLRVSFKTNTGTVKAVRGISFDLYKGRTLAIVGESGSGKSVTSKAILGILANNKIIDGGSILYDGNDLLEVSEEKFTKIRGIKISMIFQDPLSALNPIMKVGKQLTEAMRLEYAASRKNSRHNILKFRKIIKNSNAAEENAVLLNEFLTLDTSLVNNETIQKYKSLFENAVSKSEEGFVEILDHTLSELNKYNEENFSEIDEFDAKKAKIELKAIVKMLKACIFAFAVEKDDKIVVFGSSMKKHLQNYTESVVEILKREKLLTKYGVDTIYDVPSEIRIKEKEVITTSREHFVIMQNQVNDLIQRLGRLKQKHTEEVQKFVEQAINNYVKSSSIIENKLTASDFKNRAIELLNEVGIPEPERRYKQYPFELSGGMRQRIVIAIALSGNPEVLICDEPTTALDVTIQSQILELINKLKVEKSLSIIFITHDLGVVANMADDIAVMYAGKIVEFGSIYDIFYDPRHPYTWALLGSMPDLDTKEKLEAIPGTPPNMLLPPKGDAFAVRNKYALKIDYEHQPPFYKISDSHYAATWLLYKDSPDVQVPEIVLNRISSSLKANNKNKPEYELKKNSILEQIGGNK